MMEKGMPPARLSAASYGEFMPVASNDSPENKLLNRRIEIVLVPDLTQLPGFEEMQEVLEGNSTQSGSGATEGLQTPPPPPGLENNNTGLQDQPTIP